MSHFAFLDAEWPDLASDARKAESLAYPDPRTSCFYARRVLELAIIWLYKHDSNLRLPYNNALSALLAEPSFQKLAGPTIATKTRVIKDLGNIAVHKSTRVRDSDAVRAVTELFHVAYWLARTYGRRDRPAPGLAFNSARLPKDSPVPPRTQKQLQELEAGLRARDEKLTEILNQKTGLDEELKRLRAEIAEVKKANSALLDAHDYSEAETRDYFIDLLLREAGWPLDQPRDREFPVNGMPTESGQGFVDYVLWGADGRPLGLVEAKRARNDPRLGQQQAKFYADCLEKQFGQRPVLFYSNGYDHYIWDDLRHPPRPIQGFYKRDELELIIQRRASRLPLSPQNINPRIVDRYYQTRAITRVAEHFERDGMRKALLVMATGAGKTRTIIALIDLLMRANWVKRALFLADRRDLVAQAHKAFVRHLPDAGAVNLLDDPTADGRVMISTYPTMMNLIDARAGDLRRFGPGHFDLIVIDEAHRSVYQKYRAIFAYFDSLLVGLTATPREDIDRNTYALFDLQDRAPTDVYGLGDAVADGYLVPFRAVSIPLGFLRSGVRYSDLSEEEQEAWDAAEWSEDDGEPPDEISPQEINQRLFNADTVDKVLGHLMAHGEKVAGGDRLGKTIVFARNSRHARFIEARFNAAWPHLKGQFARVVEHKEPLSRTLIEDFSRAGQPPHIAISIDMLDTGIDIPEVVNLVFFKLVRSKTRFWQMVGRGTRLCPDLYGPGQDKTHFWIFDWLQNLEFFSQDPGEESGPVTPSLAERLFRSRVELLAALDGDAPALRPAPAPAPPPPGLGEAAAPRWLSEGEAALRAELATRLREEVAGMPLDNVLVRPRRRLVEHYARPESWRKIGEAEARELAAEVAGLPSALIDQDVEAKLFDALMLSLQLGRLRGDPGFPGLAQRVRDIAAALEGKAAIPMVAERLALIQDVQTDEFWEGVTLPQLETVRRRLRDLIKFIDKTAQKAVYTNFQDALGEAATVDLPLGGSGQSFERFKEKVRHFLRPREHDLPLQKLRLGLGLTREDLDTLDRMLTEAALGTEENYRTARQEGLGLFVRSLVGLDRQAAMKAFEGFLRGRDLGANQQEFITMIIEELTRTGVMEPGRLFESPFIDLAPTGVQALFGPEPASEITRILGDVKRQAKEVVDA